MKSIFIRLILLGAFLQLTTLYYAKYGREQAGPVIYNQAKAAEDYNIDRWIEQQSEEEEYEKMKEQKQKKIDTIMVQAAYSETSGSSSILVK